MDEFEAVNALYEEHFGTSTQSIRRTTEDNEVAGTGEWEEVEPYSSPETIPVEDRIQTFCHSSNVSDEDSLSSDTEAPEVLVNSVKCECGLNKNCLLQFGTASIREHIMNLQEMDKNEKEMLIMGSLQRHATENVRSGKRKRVKVTYMFQGKRVCLRVYRYIYDIGNRTLKNILKHLKTNGAVPRVHGNSGRKAHNAHKYEDIKNAVDFLQNYAQLHGLPMPAAPKGSNEAAPIFLSSKETKKAIHKLYLDACLTSGHRALGLTVFQDVWRQCLPHVKIASPREDVCATCEGMRQKIMRATSEEDKLEATTSFTSHIQKARLERNTYLNDLKVSMEELSGYDRPQGPVQPNSTELKNVHYTIDYSQLVTLPHYARQMGPLYFIHGRKIQIFAVRIDGAPVQYNYLIDEDQTIGLDGAGCQGPNGIISMVHHSMFKYGYGERRCVIHADNCAAQNKNQFMLGYLLWRLQRGLHDEIELKTQVPGHTRCLIDGGFGHIKKLYRRVDTETLQDLQKVVNNSSATNTAVTYMGQHDEPNWIWYDWKTFLKNFYRPLRGISKFHRFRFTGTDKEAVYARETSDSEEKRFVLLKKTPPENVYPDSLTPPGLSLERQNYLHRVVRPIVSDSAKVYIASINKEE